MPRATQIDLDKAIAGIRAIPGATLDATFEAVDYYGKKLLRRHFQYDNTKRYNYPPLSPKYKKYKQKKYGVQPKLVASGRLRREVLASAKAIFYPPDTIGLLVSPPSYGLYHLSEPYKRDWISPNKRDLRDVIRYLKRSMKRSARLRKHKH